MKKSRIYYSILILLTSLFILSCGPKYLRYYKQAEYHYNQKEYQFAIEKYQQAMRYGGDSAEMNFKIAEAYRRSNRLQEAEPFYSKAIAAHVTEEEAYFYHALALKSVGKYESAIARMNEYLKIGTNFDLINRGKIELKNINALAKIIDKDVYFEIANVTDLNSPEADYSPVYYNKKVYFTSSRGAEKMHAATNTGFTNIYEYTFDGVGQYTGQARELPEIINTHDAHEASAVFSKDGRTMYFAKSYNGERKSGQEVDIYMSEMQADGTWGAPVKLPINDEAAWDSNPWLSEDGKTLYFSSNREGGVGNNDLYKATRDANGVWGNVTNLGAPYNTKGNDMFPYVLPGKNRLYFASDGHPSFGGLDLFFAIKDSTGKMVIENMGAPINSSYDDFGITLKDTTDGFFCSNRPGGKGDDDIYEFKFKKPEIHYFVDISIWGKESEAGTEHELGTATILIINEVTGDTMKTLKTDDKGKLSLEVEPVTKYKVIAMHDGYFTGHEEFVVAKVPYSDLKPGYNEHRQAVKVVLPRKATNVVLTIDNIYYDYDKWNIRSDAEVELAKVVVLMQENPDISIELGSHTDERGSSTYNRNLAQKRANSAVDWIIAHGIDKSRITAKGYGEDTPFIKNAQTEEDHQKNRRTTIRVTGIDPSKNLIIKNVSEESQQENNTQPK